MISLASSLKCSGQSPANQLPKGGATDTPSATDLFPGLLAAAAPAPAGEVEAEMAPTIEVAGKAAPGTALPISLRSGKTLPVLAGAAPMTDMPASALVGSADQGGTDPVQNDIARTERLKAEDEAAPVLESTVPPLASIAQLPLPVAEGTAPSPQAKGAAARKLPLATAPKDSLTRQSPVQTKAALEQPPVEQVTAPSVTVHVAAQMKTSTDDRPLRAVETATGPGNDSRSGKEGGSALADASISSTSAKTDAQLTAPAAVPSNTPVEPLRDRAHDGVRATSPIAALHDLTSVVDRLVAAREALAPATAAITVQHGELGDLSLRFDQHRDGHLAVQLSASDPDAHRTIVAAVSDAGFRGTADGQPGTSQQPAQSQAHARGGPAERESGSAGNGSTRHDQPQHRRPSAQQQERPGGDRRRAGVFA